MAGLCPEFDCILINSFFCLRVALTKLNFGKESSALVVGYRFRL